MDHDLLEQENLPRHPLGAEYLGLPKAPSLADKIRRDFPLCDAWGVQADFLELSGEEQIALAGDVDVVVAATDDLECQRQVNAACLAAETVAVYPGIWVQEGVRHAEVGEILWVLPGRHTPCYRCFSTFRSGAGNAEARGGTGADIQVLVLATVHVVASLLDPDDDRAPFFLDEERTLILVHGLMPVSQSVERFFDESSIETLTVQWPRTPCPACGGQATPVARPAPIGGTRAPVPIARSRGLRRGVAGPIAALVVGALVRILTVALLSHPAPQSGTGVPNVESNRGAGGSGGVSAGSGVAATTITWSHSGSINGKDNTFGPLFNSVSCPSSSFCMALTSADNSGATYIYDGSTWSAAPSLLNNSDSGLNSVSCPSSSFCMAVDSGGNAFNYNGSTWSGPESVTTEGDNGRSLASVSCPSSSFCAAVDGDENAYTYNGSTWSGPTSLQGGSGLASVSCPSSSFCTAIDSAGGTALTYNGSTWSGPTRLTAGATVGNTLQSLSCASSSFCLVIDSDDNAYTYNGTIWSPPTAITASSGSQPYSASCPSRSFCMSVGSGGSASVYDGSTWSPLASIDQTTNNNLLSVSCPRSSFCMAVDGDGEVLTYGDS